MNIKEFDKKLKEPLEFVINEKAEVTTEWWSEEAREILCACCPFNECDPMACLVANPWCG